MSSVTSRGPMPADLKQRWQNALQALDPAQIEGDFAACEAAAKENSFSGFVRRSVHRTGQPLSILAEQARIESQRLVNFLRAKGTLENDELDRLLDSMGIELLGTQPK
jgi:hypothetical protein